MIVPTIDTKDYFSVSQAAIRLDLSPDTLRQYIHNKSRGRTPCIKAFQFAPGMSWMIHKDEVSRYKRERQEQGRPSKVG